MQFRRAPITLSGFIILAIVTPLCAWNGTGHQIVCLIAEDHLTPQAKAGIHDLLGADVDISDGEIASWADEVRRQRAATAPWHYVDIPVQAASFDDARDGRNGNNVIDAITAQAKIVADKSKSKDDRAEALKFLVHFVGDAHQPLHCAERDKDKGGNTRLVFYPEKHEAVNLHTVWDAELLRDAMGGQRVAAFAQALDRQVTPTQRKDWTKGTPEAWANESHRIAVESAYKGVPADGPPPRLSPEYVTANEKVVSGQLARAGVRLAWLLNTLFH